jgi:nucleoid-associated protein YgaU
MSRYDNNPIKKTFDGKEVYRTKIYPNIPLKDTDVYVMTETGDRLDTLAFQYYEDSSLWWIIAAANNIHDAPMGLQDGTILRIPLNYIQISNNFTN